MSATPDSTLADSERLIADLQRQLAECRAERDEALQRETATAEVLQVINSSPGDLTRVFEAILEKAHILCGAEHGSFVTYDGEQFRVAASHGMPDWFAAKLQEGYRPLPGSRQKQLIRGERFVHVPDIRLAPDNPLNKLSIDAGTRTLLMVPLRKNDVLLGFITGVRREVRPFSDMEIALLENFAAQAVIAMENARLITETREALEQQTATAEVLQVINSSPGDLALVFDAMLEKAVRLCEAVHGHIWMYDGERAHPVAVQGQPRLVDWMRRVGSVFPGPSPLGRALQGERIVHVADAREDEAYRSYAPFREQVDVGGIRTVLDVVLSKDNRVLGVIAVYRQEVRLFSDKQISLLRSFASQAVIAMENARLITETREALEQQTATAEVLQVINSSPGDLAPVFEAMVHKAIRLCEAVSGTLWTCDGERFDPVAVSGASRLGEWFERHSPTRAAPGTPGGRLLHGERVVHIVDVRLDPAYQDHPRFREMADIENCRTFIAVGLYKENILLGMITVYRQEVQPFTEKQIALLQNFAAQAVIAMENARLITETREALEQQTATAEVLQVINSSPGDLTPVFEAMLEKATRLCEAELGFLSTYDGENFTAVATRGVPESYKKEYLSRAYLPGPNTTHDRLVRGERVVHVTDLVADVADSPRRRAVIEQLGARTILGVPLTKDDSLLGAFHVYRREVRPFSDKQIALLQSFAAQAVIAMENARLINETREALEQQTGTAEVLRVINSSPGDLTPVFDAILEKAHTLCAVSHGGLALYDHGTFRLGASRGYPETLVAQLRRGYSPHSSHPMWRLLEGETYVHIPDLAEIDDPTAKAVVELAGIRTTLFIALRRDTTFLGMITAARDRVHPFAEKEIALLENFAAQAVIAMENARLITETREALDQQTATTEVLQVINSSPGDLGPVFDAMLDKAMRLCEAEVGNFWTYDGEAFTAVAMRDARPEHFEWARQRRRGGPGSISDSLIRGESVIHIPDAADTDAYRAGSRRGGQSSI
jgi:GAF domain-containing protein